MFGLFKKKTIKKEEEKLQNPEFLELVTKWEGFLTKMETRFTESLVNAEEAVMDSLDDSDYDLTPTLRIWQGIKTQLQGLRTKIDETFDDTVKPKMLEYIKEWEVIDEDQKGVKLGESMLDRIDRFEIIIEGKVSQKFYDHAIKFLNEDFLCTQCNGKLDVKKDIFRSHYVSCEYCNTANTFTPNSKIVAIRWIADNIAKYKAIAEWDTMKKAKEDFNEIRCPHEDQDKTEYEAGFKHRENTEREFWTKYFTERAEIIAEYKDTIEHDADVKMRWFYEERKRELNY